MPSVERYYDYFFNDLADKRVENWTFMSGPGLIMLILALYLSSVYIFLPKFMENRKPYDLKNVLFYYNIFQIIANPILIYGVLTSGWLTHYSLGCQLVDYSNDPMAVRMLSFCYWTMVLKMIDLLETIFFILRKKYNQVSKLHVYHHASTVFLGWFGTKFVGGGMATFPIMINCFIHILMYTYYLFSSLGPDWQKYTQKWKPKLTMLQLIQFGILMAHALQALAPSCKVQKQLLLLYIPNVLLITYMFYDFYQKSYTNKNAKSA